MMGIVTATRCLHLLLLNARLAGGLVDDVLRFAIPEVSLYCVVICFHVPCHPQARFLLLQQYSSSVHGCCHSFEAYTVALSQFSASIYSHDSK